MLEVQKELAKAVKHFWKTRAASGKKGERAGVKDAGNRSAVTGGKHADGFVRSSRLLCAMPACRNRDPYHQQNRAHLPGYFRQPRNGTWWCFRITIWLLPSRSSRRLVASATTSTTESKKRSAMPPIFGRPMPRAASNLRPNPGWVICSCWKNRKTHCDRPDASRSRLTRLTRLFRNSSYAKRYEEVCRRLVRERLYNTACFFTSNTNEGLKGQYARTQWRTWHSKFCRLAGSSGGSFFQAEEMNRGTNRGRPRCPRGQPLIEVTIGQ